MDPISGIVPSFPNSGYGNYNQMPVEGQYNVSPEIPTQWLSGFSPQWSDQSMIYNTSNGLISPISNGMPTSTFSGSNGEFNLFPTLPQSSMPTYQQGNGQDQGMMELGMDKDLIIALGMEGSMSMSVDGNGNMASGSGSGSGGGNGNGWEGGAGPELDFDLDQWVDGMGGGYA
jgi:hypothetical protein